MKFILDASATLAFIFPDERDAMALTLASLVREGLAISPPLWNWEIANAIVTVERRGRLNGETASALLRAAAALPVQIDSGEGNSVELARRLGLSVYDALYLDLAFRRHLPLATRDKSLIQAAQMLKVPIL